VQCPKCDALAADSDPCCLRCGKRLNHRQSAPAVPTGRPSRGGPSGAGGPRFDQVGMAVGMVGMFAGMVVASGKSSEVLKPLIAAIICLSIPLVSVCLTVWLVRRSR
jgi:hypothetical protein